MKNIRLTFRAVFEQPIGKLNPMGLSFPGPMPVEIFGNGEKWAARSLATGRVYGNLYKFTSPTQGKYTVQESFERQIEDWQAWGKLPEDVEPWLIQPEEYAELKGGTFGFRQPADFTHIIHAPSIPYAAKVPTAACGAEVDARCFINTKANVRPSCKKCAEVWEVHYQEKSA